MAALIAAKSYVSAQAGNRPLIAAACVRAPQSHDVVEVDIER
jgi:hypothetical protein